MKVTTIRFGRDLWALLEQEAELAGVSVSQYIREAALMRATAAAVARGKEPFELLASTHSPLAELVATDIGGRAVSSAAATVRSDARALRGQSLQAHAKANQALSKNEALRNEAAQPKRSRG